MRRWPSLGAMILVLSAGSAVQAAEREWAVQGNGVHVVTPCAKSVDILPGGDKGQVKVSATADHGEEIDALHVTGGENAAIDAGGARCWLSGLLFDKPTLVLTIRVPDGAAIDVTDAGVAQYSIGAVGGALHMSLSGAGGVKAVNARDLTLALSGAGSADIGDVDGKLSARLSGAGDLAVAHIHAPSTDLELSGHGSVKLGAGEAGALSASMRGAGSLTVPAASTVHLSAGGAGDVAIKNVTGALEAKLTGAGDLTVAAIDAPVATLTLSGHSDVKLGAGSIASLSLSSAGASEITVDAVVGDASITMVGASETRIAKVTGHLNQSVSGAGKVVVGEH